MPTIDDIYKSNSNFLKAADLTINGQKTKPVVEIETAEAKENTFDGETKTQIVLSFVGKEKILGLNITNARAIADLIGTTNFNEWVGYRLRLYVDKTKYEGREVDCIRIFPELPEQVNKQAMAAAAAATPEYTDDIPF